MFIQLSWQYKENDPGNKNAGILNELKLEYHWPAGAGSKEWSGESRYLPNHQKDSYFILFG